MKLRNILFLTALAMFSMISLQSCEKDEPESVSVQPDNSSTSNLTVPETSVNTRKASSTADGWYVIAKVTTGNDEAKNLKCTLEWSSFSEKQSGTIKNYQHSETMSVYDSGKTRVLFIAQHGRVNAGTYIYFRVTGRNSKYSSSKSEYMIAL